MQKDTTYFGPQMTPRSESASATHNAEKLPTLQEIVFETIHIGAYISSFYPSNPFFCVINIIMINSQSFDRCSLLPDMKLSGKQVTMAQIFCCVRERIVVQFGVVKVVKNAPKD